VGIRGAKKLFQAETSNELKPDSSGCTEPSPEPRVEAVFVRDAAGDTQVSVPCIMMSSGIRSCDRVWDAFHFDASRLLSSRRVECTSNRHLNGGTDLQTIAADTNNKRPSSSLHHLDSPRSPNIVTLAMRTSHLSASSPCPRCLSPSRHSRGRS
jgi:hypothetical protein